MSNPRNTWERQLLSAEVKLAADPSSLDRQGDVTVAVCMLRDYDRENSGTYHVSEKPAAAP